MREGRHPGHRAKPHTSNAAAHGRFDRADFTYIAGEDAYECPAGELVELGIQLMAAGSEALSKGKVSGAQPQPQSPPYPAQHGAGDEAEGSA